VRQADEPSLIYTLEAADVTLDASWTSVLATDALEIRAVEFARRFLLNSDIGKHLEVDVTPSSYIWLPVGVADDIGKSISFRSEYPINIFNGNGSESYGRSEANILYSAFAYAWDGARLRWRVSTPLLDNAKRSGGNTFAGQQVFTSSQRPLVPALTGLPAQTELISRGDGDALYARCDDVNVKIQTSNFDIASRASLLDSTSLVVPVAAYTNYQIEIFLPYWCLDGTVTQGLKVALSGPGGWSFEGSIDIVTSDIWRQAGRRFMEDSIFGVALGNTSGEASFRIIGSAFVGATAGNIAVQLAQETSSANRTRVLKGAYLKATRIEAII